jgi:hypothetical protein
MGIVTLKISEFENIIESEMKKILNFVAEEYKLDKESIVNCGLNHIDKNMINSYPSFINKKKSKPINPCNFCFAIKPNLERCTRNKKNNSIFCASHQYSQPNGRIDDDQNISVSSQEKEKEKENKPTKKKQLRTTIKLKPKIIGGKEYFIDDKYHLYVYEKIDNQMKYRHVGNWKEHNQTITLRQN